LGIIQSAGGLTESTLKASQNSLFEYLSQMAKVFDEQGKPDQEAIIKKKHIFIQKLIHLYTSNAKIDRITVPLMKTVENMLTTDYLSEEPLQE
jgi:hypothetical protein